MIKALHYLAERIEIASTFQDEKGTAHEQLVDVWQQVQGAHIDLEAAINESVLYGSVEAAKRCARISKRVQDVAEETEAFDLANHPEVVSKLPLIDELPFELLKTAKPLAQEARRHLGIR